MMNATAIVAYLVLFVTVGFLFIFAALVLGRFLRPRAPSAEKLQTYECGEPSVGSSYVQFDLRFYVVALVFLVFDVEVSFLFPWAAVFGRATQLMDAERTKVAAPAGNPALNDFARQQLRALGVKEPQLPLPAATADENNRRIEQSARQLALVSMADVGVFFAILLVAFAYVWRRGDLDWVRATERSPPRAEQRGALVSIS